MKRRLQHFYLVRYVHLGKECLNKATILTDADQPEPDERFVSFYASGIADAKRRARALIYPRDPRGIRGLSCIGSCRIPPDEGRPA
jgi:hypothetical protein